MSRFKSLKQHQPERRSRECQECGETFKPTETSHRAAPNACRGRPRSLRERTQPSFVRLQGTLNHVERTAYGFSMPTPGGFYGIVDAGRASAALGINLAELARLVGLSVADFTPPPPPPTAGLFRDAVSVGESTYVRARYDPARERWRGQVGRLARGRVNWTAVGTPQASRERAVRLAAEWLKRGRKRA